MSLYPFPSPLSRVPPCGRASLVLLQHQQHVSVDGGSQRPKSSARSSSSRAERRRVEATLLICIPMWQRHGNLSQQTSKMIQVLPLQLSIIVTPPRLKRLACQIAGAVRISIVTVGLCFLHPCTHPSVLMLMFHAKIKPGKESLEKKTTLKNKI